MHFITLPLFITFLLLLHVWNSLACMNTVMISYFMLYTGYNIIFYFSVIKIGDSGYFCDADGRQAADHSLSSIVCKPIEIESKAFRIGWTTNCKQQLGTSDWLCNDCNREPDVSDWLRNRFDIKSTAGHQRAVHLSRIAKLIPLSAEIGELHLNNFLLLINAVQLIL